jgi:hypothetical protein
MRTHPGSESVYELNCKRERIDADESILAAAKAEACLAAILDRRIKCGILLENCSQVNGAKCVVYRNFLP